jgi:hypothetical protein
MRACVAIACLLLLAACAAAVPPRKPGGPSAPRTYFPPERAGTPAPVPDPVPPGGRTSIAEPRPAIR